ncbi:hypothetical protein kuro4_00520 [Gelria sp. Kuro-4]|nr:hypothetical protein kuro4_00520 [Gelria sp. Kuro-4]
MKLGTQFKKVVRGLALVQSPREALDILERQVNEGGPNMTVAELVSNLTDDLSHCLGLDEFKA